MPRKLKVELTHSLNEHATILGTFLESAKMKEAKSDMECIHLIFEETGTRSFNTLPIMQSLKHTLQNYCQQQLKHPYMPQHP
jgi:hypothetical protein